MRNTSDPYFKQNSQEPKHFRGGEKKVMKKSLSLLVAIAMVFSMFASVAAAATPELTTQQKFDALKEAGVFSGYPPNGDAGLNKEMTRAEFAKIVAIIAGYEDNAAAAAQYTDIPKNYWASPFIGAVTAEGIMNGLGAGKFGPTGKVTVEQVAKVVVELAGLDPEEGATVGGTSAWATGYVAAAIKAGFIPEQASYKGNALRSLLVEVAYDFGGEAQGVTVKSATVIDDKNIEVTFSDNEVVKKALDTALVAGQATKVSVEYKGKTYEVEVTLGAVAISKAVQTNAREITVSFNRALTATEIAALTYEVKFDLITYDVTTKWSDDKKSVVLSSNFLPANEYTVTIKGFDAVKVKVEDGKATKLEITANSLQKADNQDLGVKLFNQFDKEIENPTLTVTVFNATQGKSIAKDEKGKYDLKEDANAKIDDNFVVTASYAATLNVSKTFKIVAGSTATSIKLGTVAPLKDKKHISVNESGLILPYEMADQYGQKVLLTETDGTVTVASNANNVNVGGITFMMSEAGVIASFKVDSKGVLTFATTGKSHGNLFITAMNTTTGASGNTTITVQGDAVVKTLQLSSPGFIIAANEEVKVPFTAVDSFGAQIAGKDVKVGNAKNNITFNSNVPFAAGYPKINGKGELLFKFNGYGKAHIYAYLVGDGGASGAQLGSLELDVREASKADKINGVKDVGKYFAVGADTDFDHDNITYLDNYGRTKNVTAATYGITVEGNAVTVANGKLTAVAVGTAKIKISLNAVDNDPEFVYDVEVVKADDIKTYAIKTIDTIYANKDLTASSAHAKTVELVGKLSSGDEVKIVQANAFARVTTSDSTKIDVSGSKIFGLDEGEATISAIKADGSKLADQVVKTSKAAPVAKTVEFKKGEYEVTRPAGLTFTVNSGDDYKVTVKDQYGVEINVDGFLYSSDVKVAAVNNKSIITGGADQVSGQATLTYMTNNSVTATTIVVVN